MENSAAASAPSSPLLASTPSSSPLAAPPPPSSRTVYSGRFIPSRARSNLALFDLATPIPSSPYCELLSAALFGPATPDRVASSATACSSSSPPLGTPVSGNIFRFKSEAPRRTKRALFADGDEEGALLATRGARPRKIPRSPYKTLDAPAMQDDFYLNLLDWSSEDVLAVGLGNCVYLWNASSNKVTKLCDLEDDDDVCSVGWAQHGSHLAVGTNQGTVQIWDASRCKRIRTMESHHMRVGALAWSSSLLSSGSRDKSILHHDIRAQEDYVTKLTAHKSEVCGLKWSYDYRQLASGGNDNRIFVWNQHSVKPILKDTGNKAAVKALAWSPHLHGLLASGGGTTDRSIRFWNTTTNTHLSCMDTGSQQKLEKFWTLDHQGWNLPTEIKDLTHICEKVCNLVWSKNINELVSTHGGTQNNIIVWRYPTMSKVATLMGHTDRVLHLAVSPDGQNIATSSGDETLRFWNVFPPLKFQTSGSLTCVGATSITRSYIR